MTVSSTPKENKVGAHSTAFVLVHGAWHGGWCWQRVTPDLIAAGHRVFAPSLTGLADRSHLLTRDVGLGTHIADIVNLIKWEELESVVLVGHSYGGMVIAGAAQELGPMVKGLVFLDAFVPSAHTSLMDLTSPAFREKREAIEKETGTGLMAPNPAEVLAVADPADREWVDRMCTPQSYKTFTDKVGEVDAMDRVPCKVYVRAKGIVAPMHDQTADRLKSSPGWTVIESPHGHDLMVDAPKDVSDILLNCATSI
ncbi:MAG: hypothetical protein CML23_26870 [Rhizobiaceae bacterium]|nr:hypothetical protein [Rhizobiaceae bacterium]